MGNPRRFVPLTLACLFVTSAACAQQSLRPVADASKRLEFSGFSVLPPQGDHWFVLGESRVSVTFGKVDPAKRVSGPAHSFLVVVDTAEIAKSDTTEDFQKVVDEFFLTLTDDRHRLLASKVNPTKTYGTDCVDYDASQEERDNPRALGAVFLITAHGFFCRHPFSPDRIVHVYYSERYVQGQDSFLDEALRRETNEFLQNVSLTPVK
jgi:hypothetical protein